MPSNHLILCCSLLLLPSFFPSIKVFSSELALHIRWAKYRSFSFSTSSFNEYSRLISFRTDWFDLLAVQGTLKSLFQHHSLKTSIFQQSASFIVQLSHPYMTTGREKQFSQCGLLSANWCFCLIRRPDSWRKKSPLAHFGVSFMWVSKVFIFILS